MIRAAAGFGILLALGVGTVRAQDAAPAAMSDAEVHRVRARLAWRHAVWHVQREDYRRAITEAELARAADRGRQDFTSLYVIGISWLRLGNAKDAGAPLLEARALDPSFPGFLLTDAMKLAGELKAEGPEPVKAAIAKFDEYLTALDRYPKDGAFAQELRFLGHLGRGRAYTRIDADLAIKDLTRAVELTREAGERPAAEVISILVQVHLMLDQMDEAKRLVREALTRDPAEAVHYYNLGLLLMTEHNPEATKWFMEALARRPDFPEAHLKLAEVARQNSDPAAMRPHLEVFAYVLDRYARTVGVPVDPGVHADMEAGYGNYWMLVGNARLDGNDRDGAMEAYANSKRRFKAALDDQPGCNAAIHYLIQVGSRSGESPAQIEAWKAQLEELGKQSGKRKLDPFRSTFC